MKLLKTLGVLLLVALAIAMILMLIMPTKQHIERSITINAPAAVVYEHLTKLDNFNKWSAWNRNDSSIRNTISGTDGTLGAINKWSGHPDISGQGEIKIASLQINREVEHEITFLQPNAMNAKSQFDLEDLNGQTKVRWQFDIATPRPWNIFNLFSSMDKKMGNDFEDGLRNLKAMIEQGRTAVKEKKYEVVPMNFPTTNFLYFRQEVKWGDIPSFYAMYMPRLLSLVTSNSITPGIPSGLYYKWDEKNQLADMAVALPILKGALAVDDSAGTVDIAGSKAVYVDYYGAYDKSAAAYKSIDRYLEDNKLKQKSPVIEQYITDPQIEKDTSKWLTRIIFLVE